MQDSRLTIIDIAREAGVSSATVSRVLSRSSNVKDETAKRVREIVDKHNYQPNSIARGLLQRQSHVLGIVMPDIKHPYYAGIFSAAQRVAGTINSTLQLYKLNYNATITDGFIRQLIERRHDGALLAGGFIESPDAGDLPAILTRLRMYMPIVTIGPPILGFDSQCVWPNLYDGVKKVVAHLASLSHKRIVFIGATPDTRSVGEREQGFRSACDELGIEAIFHYESIHTPKTGESCVAKIVCGKSRDERPTAMIVINDLVALGVLKGLRELGMKVPEDMAVVGCDNQFFSEYTYPPLTTLDLSSERLGEIAMQKLLDSSYTASDSSDSILAHSEPLIIEPKLIIRESCGAKMAGILKSDVSA